MRIEEDVSVGSGIIGTFSRLTQKIERVFAEFIDNATQSYRDHKEELSKLNINSCTVNIMWTDDKITIKDNAFGMDRDGFRRALRLNAPAAQYSDDSRSKYGMGLKLAATYLGKSYSIVTTQLGSKEKYIGEIDIDYFEQFNPTKVPCEMIETDAEDHFTEICIGKLEQKYTNATDKSLRKKLASIYNRDIVNGELNLYINGRLVDAPEAALRKNVDTGSEYFDSFADSFVVNGKKYNYSGWVGILNKASVDEAGFTIIQNGRGIVLNYAPADLLGKSNSFPHQRIVGEIEFESDALTVSFNKDGFVWDDATQKAFILSLKRNDEISKMINIAKVLRKEENIKPVVDNNDVGKNKLKIVKDFSGLKSVERTLVEPPVSDEPVFLITEEDSSTDRTIPIDFEGVKYNLIISVKTDDPDADWLTIHKKDEDNSYYVLINGLSSYFSEYKNKEAKEMLINFAVVIALARLSSTSRMDEQKAKIIISQINKIIKNAKPKEE